jgi:hypothetical protein
MIEVAAALAVCLICEARVVNRLIPGNWRRLLTLAQDFI